MTSYISLLQSARVVPSYVYEIPDAHSSSLQKSIQDWRQGDERLHPSNFVQTFKSECRAVSAWSGLPARWHTALVGTIGLFGSKIQLYNPKLYWAFNLRHSRRYYSRFLVQYHCGPRCGKLVTALFVNKDVTRIPWPSQTPDLTL